MGRMHASKDCVMNEEYRAAVARGYQLGRTEGIDAALLEDNLDALVLPAEGKPTNQFARPSSERGTL